MIFILVLLILKASFICDHFKESVNAEISDHITNQFYDDLDKNCRDRELVTETRNTQAVNRADTEVTAEVTHQIMVRISLQYKFNRYCL